MTVGLAWAPAPLARRLLGLAAVGLVLALATRRAELLAVAVPAVWLLVTAPHPALPDEAAVEIDVEPARCFEGDRVRVSVHVTVDQDVDELRVAVSLPGGIVAAAPLVASAAGTREVALDAELAPQRWGRWRIGPMRVEARSGLRLHAAAGVLPARAELVVFPHPARAEARTAVRPLPYGVGDHPSREASAGIEFSAIRPYVPGDPGRRINWPVSTRRGRLHVTTYAAERPVDVVLVIDAFSDVGPAGRSSLDLAVRGATGLAQAYLRKRDRVGLVVIGGTLRWLTPRIGVAQFYRVVEEVLGLRRDSSFLEPELLRVPRAVLPAGAIVTVLSPLLDERSVEVVRDLRERGCAMVVVDVLAGAEPPDVAPGRIGAVALRLWRLEQEALRSALAEVGIRVIPWDGIGPLDLPHAATLDRTAAAAGWTR